LLQVCGIVCILQGHERISLTAPYRCSLSIHNRWNASSQYW